MARNGGTTMDLAQFTAVAGLLGFTPPQARPQQGGKKREKMTERSVATLSVHEIGLLVEAVQNDVSTPDWSIDTNDPGHRASRVVILDDVEAAKYRGRYQIVRSITPRTPPPVVEETAEVKALKARIAELEAANGNAEIDSPES